jgi:ABC-2 type transport system permease protein
MNTPTKAALLSPVTRDATAPPSAVSIGRARAALELRLFFRDRQQVIFSFLYPVIMLVIFGSVFHGQTVTGGVSYAQYFVAGIAATGIMLSTFQALGVRISVERDQGELARLEALGTPPLAYLIGKAAQVVVITGVQLMTVLVLGRAAFDVALPAGAGRWLTLGWVALLGMLVGTVLGLAASLLPRDSRSADTVIAPIAIVLQFFSGVFFVYSTLPGWMQQVAALFPLKWMTQGMRSALLPTSAAHAEVAGGWEHGRTALVLAVWLVLGVLVCVRWFRWRRRV